MQQPNAQQGAARPAGQAAAAAGQPGVPNMGLPFMPIQDINQLSTLSGIPVHVLSNPAMQLAAQQLVAQRMMQQQMLASGQMRPMLPAQVLALQQAQMQQRMAAAAGAAAAAPKKGSTRKRGKAAAAAPAPAAMFAATHTATPRSADPLADPGGKLVWAKVGTYPWWPAKTLDPQRDLSYPPDADPPRPTSIPIRFFGTFEFQWIGSKRALTDWDKGFAQFSRECDQSSFKEAVEEAQRYKTTGRLPDVFYATPEPEKPKAKARGKKRGAPKAGDMAADTTAAVAGGGAAATTKAARGAGRAAAAEPAEDRGLVVQRRKKQRLQELGLLPPDDSPYTDGRMAPNPNLLQLKDTWEVEWAGVIAEHQTQLAAVVQRRAEAKAAADAAKATAAAAAAPPSVAALFPSAGGLPVAQQAQLQQQMFMLMQQQAAAAAAARQ